MRTLSRARAVADLRQALLDRVDDDTSMCKVAADRRIFCHGFARWSDEELFRRFRWIAARKGAKSRAELEELANRWQLQRQEALGVAISCDVQQCDHDLCWGWDEFTPGQLARFYRELLGEEVVVA